MFHTSFRSLDQALCKEKKSLLMILSLLAKSKQSQWFLCFVGAHSTDSGE